MATSQTYDTHTDKYLMESIAKAGGLKIPYDKQSLGSLINYVSSERPKLGLRDATVLKFKVPILQEVLNPNKKSKFKDFVRSCVVEGVDRVQFIVLDMFLPKGKNVFVMDIVDLGEDVLTPVGKAGKAEIFTEVDDLTVRFTQVFEEMFEEETVID